MSKEQRIKVLESIRRDFPGLTHEQRVAIAWSIAAALQQHGNENGR